MSDWADAAVWVPLFGMLLFIYIYNMKHAKDPKDELLKAKQLLDQGLIESADYEKIKSALLKRIIKSD
jgi:hypothetical protein